MRAVLAVLALAFGVDAGAAQTCAPADAVMAMVRSHPAYASHYVATDEETKAASDIFNATPPETDVRWTVAVLVSFRDRSGGLLVGHGGMICGSLQVAPDRWPAFVRAVRGSGV
jgi:hypothetical protein